MFVSLGSIVRTSRAAIVSTIAVRVCAPVLGGAVFCSIVSSFQGGLLLLLFRMVSARVVLLFLLLWLNQYGADIDL